MDTANGIRRKLVYTSGEAARICNVAPRTVSKWYNTGKLRGYRIPGCLDRRFPHDALMRFLKEYGLPIPRVLQPLAVVLVAVRETERAVLGRLLPVGPTPTTRPISSRRANWWPRRGPPCWWSIAATSA